MKKSISFSILGMAAGGVQKNAAMRRRKPSDLRHQDLLADAAGLHVHGQIAVFLFVHGQIDRLTLDETADPADRVVRLDLLKKDVAHLIVAAEVLHLADDLIFLHRSVLDDDRRVADKIDGQKSALDARLALKQIDQHDEAVLAVDALHVRKDQVLLLYAVFINIGKAHIFAPFMPAGTRAPWTGAGCPFQSR